MKAIVIEKPGEPDVLVIKTLPVPQPLPGWVLIRVKAFGLNRSELFTRQGLSPDVKFPRVLGIEAVGIGDWRNLVSPVDSIGRCFSETLITVFNRPNS